MLGARTRDKSAATGNDVVADLSHVLTPKNIRVIRYQSPEVKLDCVYTSLK